MTTSAHDKEQQRYFPRLSSWIPSLSFTQQPQNPLNPSLLPGQDQHHRTRQYSQGPWWTLFYRRNTVTPEPIVKKSDAMSQRQLSTVIRGGPLVESWLRHPLDWVHEVRQEQGCQGHISVSSSTRSSISSTSSTATAAPSLSEYIPSEEISTRLQFDLEIVIVWLAAHVLLQLTLCLAPAVKKEKISSQLCHRGVVHTALTTFNNYPSSKTEIPACWPPVMGSEIITSAAQAIGPRIANLWAEHEQSMALYKEQFPKRPTERRSRRKHRANATDAVSDPANQSQVMDLARETLAYFEQWYGDQQDSPEMKTINWLRQATLA